MRLIVNKKYLYKKITVSFSHIVPQMPWSNNDNMLPLEQNKPNKTKKPSTEHNPRFFRIDQYWYSGDWFSFSTFKHMHVNVVMICHEGTKC